MTIPIPRYGDIFTLEEFIQHVDSRALIDYDGHGHYANVANNEMDRDTWVYPSMIYRNPDGVDRQWTHVVWFNR